MDSLMLATVADVNESGTRAKVAYLEVPITSTFINVCEHVHNLEVGDKVIVANINNELESGVILGVV